MDVGSSDDNTTALTSPKVFSAKYNLKYTTVQFSGTYGTYSITFMRDASPLATAVQYIEVRVGASAPSDGACACSHCRVRTRLHPLARRPCAQPLLSN